MVVSQNYSEGQGDVVSRSIIGISGDTTWVIGALQVREQSEEQHTKLEGLDFASMDVDPSTGLATGTRFSCSDFLPKSLNSPEP